MWDYLKKDKKFIISLLFLLFLLISSIGNTIFNNGHIRQVTLLYDEKGQVSAPPFSPSIQFLFGTDRKGYDLLNLIIEGAKWTIGGSILIAVMRIFIALLIGILLGMYIKKSFKNLEAFFDGFSTLPLVMMAYFLLENILSFSSSTNPSPFYQRVLFEIFVLVILAVPTLSLYIANEIRKVRTEEFIEAANVLGGSKWHILKRHILPHLYPIAIVIFMQQFIQTLIVLLHLGLLELFFGGTIRSMDDFDSVSHEWSGLIGVYFRSLTVTPWIPLIPILFFGLTILSGNLILSSLQKSIEYSRIKRNLKEVDYEIRNEESDLTKIKKKDQFYFKYFE